MIKDLKMELLNSEQAKAINGGEKSGCETTFTVYQPCKVEIVGKPQPIPCQLQNQLHKQSGILSADCYDYELSVK